jgi:endoglycosylceramidase
MRSRLALVALASMLLLVGSAQARPQLPIGHTGRWLTDARGRVVVVHGTNMVYKIPPYDPAAVGFDNDDAAFLARIGFNAVRVGVIWKGLEPEPGVYSAAYLARIAATVRVLARHGILSLLDFHQDLYNEMFQGEGAPDWAVLDAGLPNPKLGFPGNYLGNPALQHALDAFFSNALGPGGVGLQVRFAGAWLDVAQRFRHAMSVLGYELFNEPFPGTTWELCASPVGCPFDAELTAFYRRVRGAIRGADEHTLIWYEPNVLFNDGAGTAVGGLGDGRAGFAFHDYCLTEPETGSPQGCDTFDNLVFANATGHVARTGEALLMSEFGSTTDTAYLLTMLRRADREMVPWLEWSYCKCGSPTDTGEAGIVRDPAKPPRGSNLIAATLRALVEPYPQVIAGTPLAWGYDERTSSFTLSYSTARASGNGRFGSGSETEVAMPPLVYARGYSVQARGAAIVSKADAALLVLAACPGVRTIAVTARPGGRSRESCRIRPRAARRPVSR